MSICTVSINYRDYVEVVDRGVTLMPAQEIGLKKTKKHQKLLLNLTQSSKSTDLSLGNEQISV